ncbi:tetratricopeptide repeat protein [Aquisalinus flavus]|nr:tetratricopeptide repeat protein [Aquisalinus flavus]MBD0425753.1 tetratricopeptide repeat protein [Aquisalinus flavus]
MLNRVLIGVSAMALASCSSVEGVKDAASFDRSNEALNAQLGAMSGAPSPDNMDVISKAAYWGTRYDRNPSDSDTAVQYSKALRDMENNDEALKVMTRFAETVRTDAAVNLELGKVLLANDRAFEAVRPLERAIMADPRNWSAYSAYGVALDKIGEHAEARNQYDIALSLSPDNVTILNNKGLSYALSGDIQRAELTLRKASSNREGSARVRQNLALVLGFAGKASEAERLARSDLPPRIADNNVAYFRSLVAQPAYWQEFTGDNVDLPDFGEEYVNPPRASRMTPVHEVPLTVNGQAAPGGSAPQQPSAPAATEPRPLQPQPQPVEPEEEENDEILSSLADDNTQG